MQRLMRDLYKTLNHVNFEEIPSEARLPGSFNEFLIEIKKNHYDIKTFAVFLKATVLVSYMHYFRWLMHHTFQISHLFTTFFYRALINVSQTFYVGVFLLI